MLPRPATYTQLQPEDRVTLASLKQQGLGIRAMARLLGRNASTISRELQRNSAPHGSVRYCSRATDLQPASNAGPSGA